MTPSPNRSSSRVKAALALGKQAKRMNKNSNSNTLGPLVVGSVVRVPVDRVDRGKIDISTVPGVVCEVTEHNMYRIAVKGGVLQNVYNRADIYLTPDMTAAAFGLNDVLDRWNESKRIGMREALKAHSLFGGQGHLHCNCKTKCDGGRCACKKANVICNSRCHVGILCNNRQCT